MRHSTENTEAKEEQSAFKSPLDCSLQVDAKSTKDRSWYSFKRLSFDLSEKSFQHLDLKTPKCLLLKGHARKRDILFPDKHQGPLVRSMASDKYSETYMFLL